MKVFSDLTDEEKWDELMCRLSRIENKLKIHEQDEPIPDRVRDNLREQWRGQHDESESDYGDEERDVDCQIRVTCTCGSGEIPEEVYDARGIYLCRVCDVCRKEKLSGYRTEVLEDPNYECDEPVEPEE